MLVVGVVASSVGLEGVLVLELGSPSSSYDVVSSGSPPLIILFKVASSSEFNIFCTPLPSLSLDIESTSMTGFPCMVQV